MARKQYGVAPTNTVDLATKTYVDGVLRYPGITSIATAAGTTTLTVSSNQVIVYTGTTTQICVLPTTSIVAGYQTMIVNNSTGAVTVQASGGSTVIVLAAGTNAILTALSATPTTPTNWACQYGGVSVASGSVLSVVGNAQLGGTQGVVVVTQETTTSTGWVDLTTTTDTVTVTIGPSGAAQVNVYSNMGNNTANGRAYMSFAASGANTIAADISLSVGYTAPASSSAVLVGLGNTFFFSGLTPGSTTFKMKYSVTSGTGSFGNRRLWVQPQ